MKASRQANPKNTSVMKDRRMWIIFLIIFINMLGFGIILPLLPYYVESLKAGPMTVGLIMATYSLFQLLSAPILGELSDKYGRRPILLFSIGGTALSFGLLGIATTLPMLFLSRIIDGASGGNIATAQAYIADITSKEERTQSMGMMMAAFSLGFIIGPAVGGLLSVYGYSVPALVAGAVALIATVLTYFYLPESHKPSKEVANSPKKPLILFNIRDFYDAITHPAVGLLLTISFLMMFAFSLMQGTFALFTEHSLHLTAKANGILFAYLGFIGIIVQLILLKRILLIFSERTAIVTALLSMGFSLLLIAYSGSIFSLYVAMTFLAFGNGIAGPVIMGLTSKLTPDHEQGNVAGMNQSVGSMARLVGPVAGTFLYSTLTVRSPYLIATAILGITAFFAFRKLKAT
jgi:DHA1 family tetracycline resistance protein-like MFS transporter